MCSWSFDDTEQLRMGSQVSHDIGSRVVMTGMGRVVPPRVAPARGPPESAARFDQSPAFDPSAAEPAPAFEFDQTLSW